MICNVMSFCHHLTLMEKQNETTIYNSKDLHLSAGKLAAMVGHCCEAYWTNLLKNEFKNAKDDDLVDTTSDEQVGFPIYVDYDV